MKSPGIPNPPGVSLVDPFGSSTVAVKKPKFLKVVGVFVNNQFGPEQIDVKKPDQLCIPALEIP
jgi:hypothetical protein